ncbi:glucosamine-6-phosphate deaminase [Curtanaerobium respiraculi]|uniref:glucosamine-6-phosphate deaminase n=1 Tax=Curtanaerobium respiraculi TaxID=2949669 RepID=UPI0024B34243|nr:glucosamine-6-phosphate deaminase [Curtanaerobium respiraculi]
MKIIVTDTYEEMGSVAAQVVEAQMEAKPDSILGLATGTTPISLYDTLTEDCKAGKISFADITTYNLDEYRGLPGTHDQSYRYFMDKYLFDRVDIDKSRTHLLDGTNPDADAECAAYEKELADAGYVDLQLLGLGHNGHIGFNEPADHFPVDTHLVDLTESTITANARLFDSVEDVPTQAYTMGIGTCMKARKILLVANGANKARIVRDSFQGPVVPQVPASILQLHADVTVVVDKEAGSLLDL